MGRYLILRELGGGHIHPNMMMQDVFRRASVMGAPRPTYPIDYHLYGRACCAETHSWWGGCALEPSVRRTGVDQAILSHCHHSKTLHCGIGRLREDWPDMDCVANECETGG